MNLRKTEISSTNTILCAKNWKFHLLMQNDNQYTCWLNWSKVELFKSWTKDYKYWRDSETIHHFARQFPENTSKDDSSRSLGAKKTFQFCIPLKYLHITDIEEYLACWLNKDFSHKAASIDYLDCRANNQQSSLRIWWNLLHDHSLSSTNCFWWSSYCYFPVCMVAE